MPWAVVVVALDLGVPLMPDSHLFFRLVSEIAKWERYAGLRVGFFI